MEPNKKEFLGLVSKIMLIIAIIIITWMASGPIYNVWHSSMAGQAELAQAEYSRQIAVVEANAKMESAKALAQAEVERAKGVAQANEIIAGSITENYLRYLYVQGLQTNQMQTIYIPVDGLLPVFNMSEHIKQIE